MNDLTELELEVIEINDLIRPIATRPVDTNDPNWMVLLSQGPHPLDEAGVRSAVEKLIDALIRVYESSDEDTRRAVRLLFTSYPHFAWAATLNTPPTTEVDFRRHMLLFSMRDQGQDSRDAILSLQELSSQARAAGVNTTPILQEVARLSSDENKQGLGSTRHQLNNA